MHDTVVNKALKPASSHRYALGTYDGWKRLAATAGLSAKGHGDMLLFTYEVSPPRDSGMKGWSPACGAILGSSGNLKKEGLAGEG